MERVYSWLLAAGYPKAGIDWMRRHRAAVIVALALASWGLFIGLGWIILRLVALVMGEG
jgi:hypothetical protein